ncbi:hypothetical protein GW17_00054705 [Ensete ventricosum]|nr:hypothetical protein GW17_00054705 [Ensete ventricosum]
MKSHLRSISSPTLDEQILHQGREEIVEATHDDSEDHCKEVRCIEIHAISTSRSDEFKLLMSDESDSPMPLTDEDRLGDPAPQSVGDTHLKPAMEQSIDITTGTTDNIVKPCPDASSPLPSVSKVMNSRELALARSRSCKASLMNSSILSLLENVEHGKETPPETFLKGSPGRPRLSALRYDVENEKHSVEGSQASEKLISNDTFQTEDIKTVTGEADANLSTSFSGTNEMDECHCHKQLPSYQNVKDVGVEAVLSPYESPSRGPLEFERKRQEIVELWHACNVPLVHRTCFFLVFGGDPADSFYMEVEYRRLSFLRNTFSHGNAGDIVADEGRRFSLASREMLWKQMQKKLSQDDRVSLYAKWGVDLNSKQRKWQLGQRLWTKTDLEHVKESASLVAKLIGFVEQGRAMKEMFGLSFTPQQTHKRSFSWMQ